MYRYICDPKKLAVEKFWVIFFKFYWKISRVEKFSEVKNFLNVKLNLLFFYDEFQ